VSRSELQPRSKVLLVDVGAVNIGWGQRLLDEDSLSLAKDDIGAAT
jgi:hypothetical protein